MSQSEGTESKNAIEHLKRLGKKYETFLGAARADLSQLLKEFTETLQYAIRCSWQHLITRRSGGCCFMLNIMFLSLLGLQGNAALRGRMYLFN